MNIHFKLENTLHSQNLKADAVSDYNLSKKSMVTVILQFYLISVDFFQDGNPYIRFRYTIVASAFFMI